MLTHNRVIYHCLRCGAILHCERDQEIPCCCGRPMFNAAAQTVMDDQESSRLPVRPTGGESTTEKPRQKACDLPG